MLSGGPWFNLFNLGGKSEAEMKKLKLNEIKNGRLAMLAVFGYGAQVGRDSSKWFTYPLKGPWLSSIN